MNSARFFWRLLVLSITHAGDALRGWGLHALL